MPVAPPVMRTVALLRSKGEGIGSVERHGGEERLRERWRRRTKEREKRDEEGRRKANNSE